MRIDNRPQSVIGAHCTVSFGMGCAEGVEIGLFLAFGLLRNPRLITRGTWRLKKDVATDLIDPTLLMQVITHATRWLPKL